MAPRVSRAQTTGTFLAQDRTHTCATTEPSINHGPPTGSRQSTRTDHDRFDIARPAGPTAQRLPPHHSHRGSACGRASSPAERTSRQTRTAPMLIRRPALPYVKRCAATTIPISIRRAPAAVSVRPRTLSGIEPPCLGPAWEDTPAACQEVGSGDDRIVAKDVLCQPPV